jgi:hypothetical protein
MIYKKLLEFQKLGISVKKSSTNPHFRSNYADLNEVLDKVTKPLNNLGVVILQEPQMGGAWGEEPNRAGLITTLYDTEDDTKVSGFLPFVQMDNAQKLGANITYNRRYSLVTMLGLEDEDDDGNKASTDSAKSQTEAVKNNDLDI